MAPSAEVLDPHERLLQISEAYVNCARAYPSQFRLMFGPLLSRKREFPAFQAASEQAFALLLAAATAQATPQPQGTNPGEPPKFALPRTIW